jgi:hypothetical protein
MRQPRVEHDINRSSTLDGDPAGESPARLMMAHEQETIRVQTLQARDKARAGRWPVPYAILFITGVSVALWSLIIALANWLIG